VLLIRRYARRFPSRAAYELASALKLAVKVAGFESARLRKIVMMARGTRDGLRRLSGEFPG
jgi:hypothetical protein